MSSIPDVTAATASGIGASSAAASTEIQDRFLKLLVTQLKNQDPLNPLDNAQLTTQLAQINTVSGLEKLNSNVQGLASSLLAAQSLQSASLIGHAVLAEGNKLTLSGKAPAQGGIELARAADSVKVNIVGPAGNLVRQLDLGAQPAGTVGFQWDGLTDSGATAAPGYYTFQVAASAGSEKLAVNTVTAGKVTSVTLGSDGLRLAVEGIGDLQMSQVKRIM